MKNDPRRASARRRRLLQKSGMTQSQPSSMVEIEYRTVFAPPAHKVSSISKKHLREEPVPVASKSPRLYGMALMRSERWNPPGGTKVRTRGIPFIDKGGHISGSSLMTWKCSSTQWFATVVHSVFARAKKRMNRPCTNKRKLKNDDLLMRIAIYYVCTLDDSAFERLLCCYTKGARKLLTYRVNAMDDRQRFLYGQATQSCSWLRYRGCPPRVQSIKKTVVSDYRRFGLQTYDSRRPRTEYLNWLCDPWIVGPLRLLKNESVTPA